MKLNSKTIKDPAFNLMNMSNDLLDDAMEHKEDEIISKSADLFPPMVFPLLALAGYYTNDEGLTQSGFSYVPFEAGVMRMIDYLKNTRKNFALSHVEEVVSSDYGKRFKILYKSFIINGVRTMKWIEFKKDKKKEKHLISIYNHENGRFGGKER